MRHRIYGYTLGRKSEHRRALLRNLAAGLFEHGEIRTTMPKAKAVQPFVERIITMARQGNLHARRQLEAKFGRDRWIHVWVADENVPESRKLSNPWFNLPRAEDIQFDDRGEVVKAPRLVEHIMSVVAPMFEGREGGYTRIVRTGERRLGDAADVVILQLVGREDGPQIGGSESPRRSKASKRAEFAAKLAAGWGGAAVAEEEEEASEAAAEEAPAEEVETSEESSAPEDSAADDASEDAAAED